MAKRKAAKKTQTRSIDGASTKNSPEAARATIQDPTLGKIAFAYRINPTMDEYAAKVEIGGASVELMLYTDEDLDLKETIRHARDIVKRYPAIWKKLRQYILDGILPLFNREWRVEEQPPLGIDSFLEQVSLMDISIYQDGKATFTYDPDELFRGHLFLLEMDSSKQFTNYGLMG